MSQIHKNTLSTNGSLGREAENTWFPLPSHENIVLPLKSFSSDSAMVVTCTSEFLIPNRGIPNCCRPFSLSPTSLLSIGCRWGIHLKRRKRGGTHGIVMSRHVENCQNPWKNSCKNVNIEVYIVHERQQLPICAHCWRQIADDDCQWDG